MSSSVRPGEWGDWASDIRRVEETKSWAAWAVVSVMPVVVEWVCEGWADGEVGWRGRRGGVERTEGFAGGIFGALIRAILSGLIFESGWWSCHFGIYSVPGTVGPVW